jgi:hypothetical protein
MKAHGGRGDTTPVILNFRTIWKRVVTFVSATLRLETEPPVLIKYEAVWGPRMETFLGFPIRELREWEGNKDNQPEQISPDNFIEN